MSEPTTAGSRAVIYARFSSDAQRDVSIDIQVRQCTELIEREGWRLVQVYADYAMTGRNDERPEFQRMRADMEAGRWDVLVVYKQDRLARNVSLATSFKSSLFSLGKRLVSCREGEVSDTPEGFLNSSFQDIIAEYYSRNLAVLIRGGIQANARMCKANGQRMYGWSINADGYYEVDEEQRAHMVKMKDMLLAGETIADITRASAAMRTQFGNRFTQSGITKLLKREQNAGVYKYAGYREEGGMPALWSMEEQERIWAVLRDNERPRKTANTEHFPLSQKMFCECGGAMVGVCGTSKSGKRYYYYRCKECRKQVRKEKAEAAVKEQAVAALADEGLRERIADMVMAFEGSGAPQQKQSELLKRELRKVETARENVWKAIEEGIDPEGGRGRLDELVARRNALLMEISAAEQAEQMAVTRDRVLFWLECIADADPEVAIETFVRAVWRRGEDCHVAFTFDDEQPDPPPDDGEGKGECSHEWESKPPSSGQVSRLSAGLFAGLTNIVTYILPTRRIGRSPDFGPKPALRPGSAMWKTCCSRHGASMMTPRRNLCSRCTASNGYAGNAVA